MDTPQTEAVESAEPSCAGAQADLIDNRDGDGGCVGCGGESLCDLAGDPAAMEAALIG